MRMVGHQSLHRHPLARLIWCLVGAACAIALALFLVGPPNAAFVLASLGGSSVFLFGLTRAPAAQPRALFGGHLLGALAGIVCFQFLGTGLLAYASAVALALGLMLATRTVHPPAGANPIIMVYADTLRYEDLDAATLEKIKTHVIDTIGCGIGAFDERPVRICRDIALSVGGPATIIGTKRRTSTELATFANCAAFRYLDFNDTYVGRFSVHPSDHIAACIAVAEAERASARELITAIAVAYEVNCRLVDALDISTRGWDPPVLSLPSVALAAGKLMKLGPERLTHAVNLAINDHIPMAQTRVQTLSDWKGLADAEAGRNAVFAASLARGGLTRPAPIFDGQSGFFRQVTGPADVDV